MFGEKELNNFYSDISCSEGMQITTFQNTLESLFSDSRTNHDIEQYRLGRNSWKKLRDEVVPVSSFLKLNYVKADRIRFPLDNHTPDCWLMSNSVSNRGMEVTIERGREHYHLATELNKEGLGRGFIGLQDDDPQSEFTKKMSRDREMYTTEQALEATKHGIMRCLSRKNQSEKYRKVHYLLIQAHLNILPRKRWEAIKEDLIREARILSFQEIHVIGDSRNDVWGFQIK
ncbi:hypothetical protein A3197_03325 [Candidatus Thiodiazotropha endoloripes]|nr:hypothetical protein A3197_03325 [Candidatus Thiodiazotropha endoloripes]